jgi:hypothetical protein
MAKLTRIIAVYDDGHTVTLDKDAVLIYDGEDTLEYDQIGMSDYAASLLIEAAADADDWDDVDEYIGE